MADFSDKNPYISFPMGDGIKGTQKLIFTKVKNPLLHMHTFVVVASWSCPAASCRARCIALFRDNNLCLTINGLISYRLGPLYRHMTECHGIPPIYPDTVRILSGKPEKEIFALKNGLAIEMAANPLLICVTGGPTNSVGINIIDKVTNRPYTHLFAHLGCSSSPLLLLTP